MSRTKRLSRREAAEFERRQARIIRIQTSKLASTAESFDAGDELIAIQEGKLYRPDYPDYQTYVRDGLGMSRARAYQLTSAARCRAILATSSTGSRSHVLPPQSVRQVRDIAGLPPGQMRRAWRIAIKSAGGGQPSPAQVRAARDRVTAEQVDGRPE